MSSTTNWFDLPPELKVNILSRIGHFQILENAQYVCSDWYKVCKDPSIWKVINLFRLRESIYSSDFWYAGLPGIWKICKNVVDRSGGQLVDIVIPDLQTDEVLMYVADSDWYKVCKDPSIWKVINLFRLRESIYSSDFWYGGLPGIWKICKNVVDRSGGQLVDIVIPDLQTDEVLMYVADRSRKLKRLYMRCGWSDDLSIKSLHEALKKFPLLEELSVDFEYLTKEAIESAGRYCPLLKTLTLKKFSSSRKVNDEIGAAIGENLHELRHLKLINNTISNIGLKAILDGCHQLELLDLSVCVHIDLNGDVVKKCSERIKHLTLPDFHYEE
ncbi:putative F-box/LRR-repeat protein 9 [Rutidosis leptorrhynchoides]|uniref:putative F-box/LRR-repeat protein 9 n=1 Tax=Rutidosis leptorrhynchoides TaxID=125765 RepID=UPI003A994515